jgi:co-chaperonin GroES (HSP10)
MREELKDKLLNITLNNTSVLVKRFPVPKATQSGLIIPTSFTNEKQDTSEVYHTDEFQKRGEIVHISPFCSEGFRDVFKVGDKVHFCPNCFRPVPLDKEHLSDSTEFILVDQYCIDWKENK